MRMRNASFTAIYMLSRGIPVIVPSHDLLEISVFDQPLSLLQTRSSPGVKAIAGGLTGESSWPAQVTGTDVNVQTVSNCLNSYEGSLQDRRVSL